MIASHSRPSRLFYAAANLKKWSDSDLKEVLTTGLTPDGDMVSTSMAEVVENTTSQLSATDLDAVVAYLRTLPSLPDEKK